MNRPTSNALSVKTRVALSLTLLFAAAIALVTAVQVREIRSSMAQELAAQQNTLVTRVADEVDEKFRMRQAAMAAVAAGLGPAVAQGRVPAQAALESHQGVRTMFDTVLIFSAQGQILANSPFRPDLATFNAAQRPYFKDTVASAKGVISAPYRSRTDGEPTVMMTAPIVGADGNLVGILGGSLSLLKPNFLGNIGSTRVGQSGYLYVMTRSAQPTVVSHPDRAKIMAAVAEPGKNPSSAMAQAGFEGTVEGVNSAGVRALMSFSRLKETDWIMATVLPVKEAFGPINAAEDRVMIFAALIAAAVGVLTWALAYWLLIPLAALREYVRAKGAGAHPAEELAVRRWDEIGDLTHEFNALMRAQEAGKQALAANEARLVTITDNVPVLIAYVGLDQRYRFVNHAYEDWFGVDQKALLGKTLLEIFGAEGYAAIRADVDEVLQGYVTNRERELTLRGRTRIVHSTYMPDYGPDNQVRGFYVMAHDITAQKLVENKLAFLAHHDTLTALPNRAAFIERLSLAILRVKRTGKPCALMYLDIDKFKSVNDTRGHGVGDQLLQAFARRLTDAVRRTDVVGRLGGDEFVILAEDLAHSADAAAIAQKIVDAMGAPFRFGEIEIRATTSIGVAICAPDYADSSATALLERADAALYQAKQAGRNTYRLAEPKEWAAPPTGPALPDPVTLP
jgi:diguanylate cyclase (GGDEF)-like protein/PAS domain S-box-containing protein